MKKVFLLFFLVCFASAEMHVTNETITGGNIYVFITDRVNGSLINGTLQVITPGMKKFNIEFVNGQAEINATETGQWTVKYQDYEKTVLVNTANVIKEKEPDSLLYINSFIHYVLILLVIVCACIIVFFAFLSSKETFQLIKNYKNNKVVIFFKNNTGARLRNVIIKDRVHGQASCFSVKPYVKGKIITWKLKSVAPYEQKKITYTSSSANPKVYGASAQFMYDNKKIILDTCTDSNAKSKLNKTKSAVNINDKNNKYLSKKRLKKAGS